MAKPTHSVSIPNLSADFQSSMILIDAGKSIEVQDRRVAVGILSANNNNIQSEHTFSERDATSKLRMLMTLVAEGKDVVITRMGNKPSVLLTRPEKNEPQ